MDNINICWKPLFDQFDFDINKHYTLGTVYPPKSLLFRVFEMDVKDIRVVFLGQDPYHGPNQADGFSFSSTNKIPPSLRNIFKELLLEFPNRHYVFNSANLSNWFYREKIFLLNSALTVLESKPRSNIKIWEKFTDSVIKFISDNNKKCVFLLLGKFAKNKSKFITDQSRIIYGIHPSPIAQGFIGSNVFKKVEEKLGEEINWSV